MLRPEELNQQNIEALLAESNLVSVLTLYLLLGSTWNRPVGNWQSSFFGTGGRPLAIPVQPVNLERVSRILARLYPEWILSLYGIVTWLPTILLVSFWIWSFLSLFFPLPSPDVSSNNIYIPVWPVIHVVSSYQPGYHFVLDYRYAQASKY